MLVSKFEGGRDRLVCPECGHIVFGNFSLSVGGLLFHDGRVLLVQHSQEHNKDLWTLPGGYVETDEAPDAAVVREVLEETGLHTRVVGLLGFWHLSDREQHEAYCVFSLELTGLLDEMKPGGDGYEIQRVQFVCPDRLDLLGEIGPVARWFVEHYRPEEATLLRVPDAEQPIPRRRYTTSVIFGPRV